VELVLHMCEPTLRRSPGSPVQASASAYLYIIYIFTYHTRIGVFQWLRREGRRAPR
jgi:hypothetical protein